MVPAQRSPGRTADIRYHERVFPVAGPATGAGLAVTMLSDFNSSGLNTNSLSCGVSMACTQTCRLTPLSPRYLAQRAEIFCATLISSRGGPLAAELIAAT